MPPQEILDRLAQVTKEDFHQYATTWGAQDFREAVAAKQTHFMGCDIDPNKDITVTCGSTEAMMAAMLSVTNPGDKVIVFSPFYENYGAGRYPVRRAAYLRSAGSAGVQLRRERPGGRIQTAPEGADTVQSVQPLRQGIHPGGASDNCRPRREIRHLGHHGRGVRAHRLRAEQAHLLLDSSAHEGAHYLLQLPFQDLFHHRLAPGYVIAPPEVSDRIRKVHDFLTVGAAAPLQEAAVVGLRFGDDYYKWLRDKYTHMRTLFLDGLDRIGITHNVPQGAYYVMVDVSEFGYSSDLKLCEALAQYVGVGAVPGSSFFREPENRYIRLHFAKQDDTLNAALDRLADIRKKLPKE